MRCGPRLAADRQVVAVHMALSLVHDGRIVDALAGEADHSLLAYLPTLTDHPGPAWVPRQVGGLVDQACHCAAAVVTVSEDDDQRQLNCRHRQQSENGSGDRKKTGRSAGWLSRERGPRAKAEVGAFDHR
jgi:hypothetical protein